MTIPLEQRAARLLALFTVSTLCALAAPGRAQAASLVEVTGFGSNPTNLRMHLYVPNNVAARPAILVANHPCGGTGPQFYQSSEFASLADRYGFIVIYPSANKGTGGSNCFDIESSGALKHDGNSDPAAVRSMVAYVVQKYGADTSRIFATGSSSGAMFTNLLMADYPDVFAAGAPFMSVPVGCMEGFDPNVMGNACSQGKVTKTAAAWGDIVRNAYPGYTGPRPRVQLWHGTADSVLNFANLAEEVKQWTNVMGLSATPALTDAPQSGWSRSRYGGTGVMGPLETITVQGANHVLPQSGQAAYAIAFFGLDKTSTGYTLSVVNPSASAGTVTSSTGGISCGTTCSATYPSGTAVTLTASPAAGSSFAGWSGACTGTGPCVVTMTANQTVTASWGGDANYTLAVSRTGSGTGTVTSSVGTLNCGTTCTASYSSGTAVTLTATPASGSTFSGWSGACTGSGTCIVTMTANLAVTASFTGSTPTGTVSINAGGAAVSGFSADAGFSGGTTYTNSATIDTSLLASPVPPASIFNTERYGNFTYTITGLTPSSAQTVTLYFAETYQTAAGRRSFGVSINGTSVLSAFDIYAAAGGQNKAISRAFNTTASASGQVVIQFTNGTVDNAKVNGITVAAASGPTPTSYALSVSTSGSGTVTGGGINCGTACTANYDSGTVVTLTATPATGGSFSGWSGACTGTAPTCVVPMSAAQSVSAAFAGSNPGTPCANPVNFTGSTSNFNTTGAVCFRTSGTINGWGCANFAGRTVSVNGGTATSTCGAGPFPLAKSSDGYTYFSVTAGTYPWASIYTW